MGPSLETSSGGVLGPIPSGVFGPRSFPPLSFSLPLSLTMSFESLSFRSFERLRSRDLRLDLERRLERDLKI